MVLDDQHSQKISNLLDSNLTLERALYGNGDTLLHIAVMVTIHPLLDFFSCLKIIYEIHFTAQHERARGNSCKSRHCNMRHAELRWKICLSVCESPRYSLAVLPRFDLSFIDLSSELTMFVGKKRSQSRIAQKKLIEFGKSKRPIVDANFSVTVQLDNEGQDLTFEGIWESYGKSVFSRLYNLHVFIF